MKQPLPAEAYPVLSEVLGSAGLKLVDIGGRGEAFGGVLALAPFAQYYVCEPDVAEAARLAETLPRQTPWRGVTVFTEAMASRAGGATLHMTRAPGMSSLFEPDRRVAGRYWVAPKFEVVGAAPVPTMALDEASRRYGFADASFLKLDTQGSELDILSSGPGLVGNSLVGIHTEALFQPFYRGQPLFADLDSHLRARGFSLVTMRRTLLRRAGFDPSIYSRRSVAWAHCLYLREPDQLQETAPDPEAQLVRLLALAIAFDHFDLALEIVSRPTGAGALSEACAARLAADLRRLAADVTSRLRQASAKDLTRDDPTSRSFKDRKRYE